MEKPRLPPEPLPGTQVADYSFVVTILWIGFILAIGFLETPLRFQAESVTRPVALRIGRLVFHALNCCELVFAGILIICAWRTAAVSSTKHWLAFGIAFLVIQTVLLFAVLDSRTEAVINQQEVAESPIHTVYIDLECAKLLVLSMLARSQLIEFKRRILRQGG